MGSHCCTLLLHEDQRSRFPHRDRLLIWEPPAGVACAASGTADVVDAIVVATAVRHQAPVAISDPRDLTHIAEPIGLKIQLFST